MSTYSQTVLLEKNFNREDLGSLLSTLQLAKPCWEWLQGRGNLQLALEKIAPEVSRWHPAAIYFVASNVPFTSYKILELPTFKISKRGMTLARDSFNKAAQETNQNQGTFSLVESGLIAAGALLAEKDQPGTIKETFTGASSIASPNRKFLLTVIFGLSPEPLNILLQLLDSPKTAAYVLATNPLTPEQVVRILDGLKNTGLTANIISTILELSLLRPDWKSKLMEWASVYTVHWGSTNNQNLDAPITIASDLFEAEKIITTKIEAVSKKLAENKALLADVYQKSGREQDARQILWNAIQLAPDSTDILEFLLSLLIQKQEWDGIEKILTFLRNVNSPLLDHPIIQVAGVLATKFANPDVETSPRTIDLLANSVEQYLETLEQRPITPITAEYLPGLLGLVAESIHQKDYPERAINFLRRVTNRFPNQNELIMMLSDYIGETGHFKEAASQAKTASSIHPLQPPVQRKVAKWLEKAGSWEEAYHEWSVLHEDLDRHDAHPEISDIKHYAAAALQANQPIETVRILKDLPEESFCAEDYLVFGQAEAMINHPDTAIHHLEQSIQLDPTRPDPYLALSDIYFRQDQADQGEEILKKGLASTNNSPATHLALAKHYHANQAETLALEHCQKVLSGKAPEQLSQEAGLMAYQIHENLGDFRKANKALAKALENYPGNAPLASALARSHMRAGELEAAYQIYGELADQGNLIEPEDYLSFGRLAIELDPSPEKISRAIQNLQNKIGSKPESLLMMQELLIEAYLKAGDGANASKYLETMRLAIPSEDEDWQARLAILSGKAAFLEGNYLEAVTQLTKGTSERGISLDDRKILCLALVELGNSSQAVKEAHHLVNHYPERQDLGAWLVNILAPRLILRCPDYLEKNPTIILDFILPAVDQASSNMTDTRGTDLLKAELYFLCHDYQASKHFLSQVQTPTPEQINNSDLINALLRTCQLWVNFQDVEKATTFLAPILNPACFPEVKGVLCSNSELALFTFIIGVDLAKSLGKKELLEQLHALLAEIQFTSPWDAITAAWVLRAEGRIQDAKSLLNAAPTDNIHIPLAKFILDCDEPTTEKSQQISRIFTANSPCDIYPEKVHLSRGLLAIAEYGYLTHQNSLVKEALEKLTPKLEHIPLSGDIVVRYHILSCAYYLDMNEEIAAADHLTQLLTGPASSMLSTGLKIRLLLRQGEYQQAAQELQSWSRSEQYDPLATRIITQVLLESAAWDEGVSLLNSQPLTGWATHSLRLDLIDMMLLRWEAMIYCERLEVMNHRPKQDATNKIAQKQLKKLFAEINISMLSEEEISILEKLQPKYETLVATGNAYPRFDEIIAEYEQLHAKVSSEDNQMPALSVFYDWHTAFLPPFFYLVMCDLAVKNHNYRAGLYAISTALSIWPDEPRWHAKAAGLYRTHFSSQSQQAKTIYHYQEAIRLEPNYSDHYKEAAGYYLEIGKPREAVQTLSSGTTVITNDAELWSNLGSIQMNQNNHAEAIKSFDQALAISPDHLDTLISRAELALQTNDPHTAAKLSERALGIMPNNPKILILLSRGLESVDRTADALKALQKANDLLELQSVELLLETVRLLHKTKQFKQAALLLEKALEIHPPSPTLLAPYIESLEKDGKVNQAIQVAERMLGITEEENPPTVQARYHYLLGMLYRKEGKKKESIRQLNACLEKDPLMLNALLEIGLLYREDRKAQFALTFFQRAIHVAPADPRPYLQAGITLKESKDYLGAEAMLSQAAELAPNDVDIQRQFAAVKAVNLVHSRV